MQITCPKCHHALSGTDINIATSMAVCRECGGVFALPAVVSDVATVSASVRPTVESVRRYRPDDLSLTESHEGEASVMRLRPARNGLVFSIFFATVWWSFLIFWYAKAVPGLAHGGGWVMVLFPLIHVGAGVGMVYGILGQLFNVTTLRLEGGGLTMITRPFARHFTVRAPLEVIDGFGVYDATARGGSGTPTPNWQVQLMRADGTSTALKLALRSPAHAQYVADLLNARLGALRDAREPGYRMRG